MLGTVLAGLLAAGIAQAPLYEVKGVVADTLREPLPGVTVVLTGSTFSRITVSDPRGRYRFIALPAGEYTLIASIPGFRTQTRALALSANATIDFALTHPPLMEVLSIVPDTADAYTWSDVIALLRIDRSLPPEACGQVVTSTYEAAVLEVIKGTPPPSILVVQEAAGVCLDGGREVRGIARPFQAGDQFVVFLQRKRERFVTLGGSGLTFAVSDGRIETGRYGGFPATMTLGEFQAALESSLFTISGVVTNRMAEPLSGVVVSIGPERLFTDGQGRYRVALPQGAHRVIAGLPGYRSQRRDVSLTKDTVVDFALSPGHMVAVDFILLDPQQAHREADAIARLRIERSLPPQPCDLTVSITHEATVLDLIKGTLPSSVLFAQRGAGVCVQQDGVELEGADRPYASGEEYVAFLRRKGDRFQDLTGSFLTFKVENGIVQTRGYANLPATLPLTDFYAAVRAMARLPGCS